MMTITTIFKCCGIFGDFDLVPPTPSQHIQTTKIQVQSQDSAGMLHKLSGGAWDPHDVNSVAATCESYLQFWDVRTMKYVPKFILLLVHFSWWHDNIPSSWAQMGFYDWTRSLLPRGKELFFSFPPFLRTLNYAVIWYNFWHLKHHSVLFNFEIQCTIFLGLILNNMFHLKFMIEVVGRGIYIPPTNQFLCELVPLGISCLLIGFFKLQEDSFDWVFPCPQCWLPSWKAEHTCKSCLVLLICVFTHSLINGFIICVSEVMRVTNIFWNSFMILYGLSAFVADI